MLVVGDFRGRYAEALALRELGARVFVAGVARAADKRVLEQAGVAVSGLVRTRKQVLCEAVDRTGGCDVTLVIDPEWDCEYQAIVEIETERAVMDGRPRVPIFKMGDERYDFLKTPVEWAAYAAALAAGARTDVAKEFATGQSVGHTNKNSRGRTSGRTAVGSGGKRKTAARRNRPLRPAAR